MINMSKRKSTLRGKLKVASQEESLQKWKDHLKHLLGIPLDIIDEVTEKMFTPKTPNSDFLRWENLTPYWKKNYKQKSYRPRFNTSWIIEDKKNLHIFFFDHITLYIMKWTKGWIHLSSKKRPENMFFMCFHHVICSSFWQALHLQGIQNPIISAKFVFLWLLVFPEVEK